MKIGHVSVGLDAPPLIIAEVSGNHNGSLDRALAIVDAVAAAGAQALKLQTYTADTMTLDLARDEFFIADPDSLWSGKSLYALYQEAHTPWEWHAPIFERARRHGMLAFSTPFDATAVDFLEQLDVPAYKIASFENVDLPLIRKVGSTGKPVIISTGLANLFQCDVGLSDHTLGTGAAVGSVGLGACVIEKHVTLKRSDGGVDSAFSLEPSELAQLVTDTKIAWEALGHVQIGPTEEERASLVFRRSLYVCDDLEAGDVLTPRNLRAIRPGHGLAPKHLQDVMGRRVTRAVKRGTPMSWDLVGSHHEGGKD